MAGMTRRPDSGTGLTDPTIASKPCHLLALPGELRNAIYDLILTQPIAVHVLPFDARRIGQEAKGVVYCPRLPSLLMTCRTIRDEALPIFYRANAFSFVAPRLTLGCPISFSEDMSLHVPHMRGIEITRNCGCCRGRVHTYIYDIDMASYATSLRQSIDDACNQAMTFRGLTFRQQGHYQACSASGQWFSQLLAGEMAKIADEGDDAKGLNAEDLRRLIGVLQYPLFA